MAITTDNTNVRVLRPYLVYVLLFVGAGMVSGGVVHYPLNENFYGVLAALGGIVFAIGSLANELISGKGLPKAGSLFSLILTSLLLSFGIGMLSGGIQHFTDFPSRAAKLVPLGITLSFIAYCFKANLFNKFAIKKLTFAGVVILATAMSSLVVLTNIANGMNTPAHTHEVVTGESEAPQEDHSKHPHNE
jgi:Ca2+/H+ antiporter